MFSKNKLPDKICLDTLAQLFLVNLQLLLINYNFLTRDGIFNPNLVGNHIFAFCLTRRGVLFLVTSDNPLDPIDIMGDARVDARVVGLGTVETAHHNAVNATVTNCGTTGIALAGILSSLHETNAHNVFVNGSPITAVTSVGWNDRYVDALQLFGRFEIGVCHISPPANRTVFIHSNVHICRWQKSGQNVF